MYSSIERIRVRPMGTCLETMHHISCPLGKNFRQMKCTRVPASADCSAAVADASSGVVHEPCYCFCSVITDAMSRANELKILPEAVCGAPPIDHLLTVLPMFSQGIWTWKCKPQIPDQGGAEENEEHAKDRQ